MLSVSLNPPPANPNVAQNYSFVTVNNDKGVPLFAQATFDVNYSAETGQNGASFFSTTSLSAGNWYAIQFIADTTFTGLTGNWVGNNVTNAITFKAGNVIYGSFQAIQLATGVAVAYNT
jgi:hypothetical protein